MDSEWYSGWLPVRDRKSTRLNSSHTEIYTLSLHDALPILEAIAAQVHQSAAVLKVLAESRVHGLGVVFRVAAGERSEEHTSELQSHRDLHSFPTRRSSDLRSHCRPGTSIGRRAQGTGGIPCAWTRSGIPGGCR